MKWILMSKISITLSICATKKGLRSRLFFTPYSESFSFHNRNKRLRKREFKTFRRSVKRLARNKGCAKNFWKYCDKDENGEMTKDEWNVCLGTNELKDCK